MTREQVFEQIKEIGIIPAIRPGTTQQAVHAAGAIKGGGVAALEVCLAMPHALDAIAAVAAVMGPGMIVGAGTAIDGESVHRAREAGAQFIVTSGFSMATVEAAHELEMAIFAGAMTPTEVQVAYASGVTAVKLFPCNAVGGPRYLKSLRGQYPQVEFIASGGIGLENCVDYLRAGACAIGVGGEIGDAESMAAGDHRLFTERARRFRKAVVEARSLFAGARPR